MDKYTINYDNTTLEKESISSDMYKKVEIIKKLSDRVAEIMESFFVKQHVYASSSFNSIMYRAVLQMIEEEFLDIYEVLAHRQNIVKGVDFSISTSPNIDSFHEAFEKELELIINFLYK